MLTTRYMASAKNLTAILDKIVTGTAPAKFTAAHLKSLGFSSSNDRAIIPLLKDLKFLSPEGTPTKRYHEYRNSSQSRAVLGEALKEAYEPVFHVNATPTKGDRSSIEGVFKSVNNVSERIAQLQAATFFALLSKADLGGVKSERQDEDQETPQTPPPAEKRDGTETHKTTLHLRHNIEVHLPATKDIEVYNAIFKSLKEHLID